ncbi:transcription factor IIIB 90 kDa subunit [Hetaerina americana]|uniref:transcription factor IIIB 90 kDa subunit n=1 Tax=Hetaerina americana TaxID=62018 RepID=UPI003A7F3E3A
MSSKKCQNCGCTEIDTDPARGDAVCTGCGSVLEDNIIVSEIQYEENAHGGSSSIGQFVSSDSKGGGGFAGGFHSGLGKESREITLRVARKGIVNLAQQLRLNQHCTDTAFNFFKMALNRNLTRGRKHTHVLAACVYMTCRTEGTPHMLIDFSDVLQICVYELGRTYLRLSQALCINIPAMDPCIYVLRFASRLEFEKKTHEVSLTAIRLLQRMKRDWLHTGRRPSGLCGAALLIAARLHDFNRTPMDIIKIVKIHESTLRKRLFEFGETPSSSLTLDEFMTVDLEEEQDPPAFKAARKRDRDRLQKLIDEEDVDDKVTQLQKEIDKQIEERRSRTGRPKSKLKAGDTPSVDGGYNRADSIKEKEDTERFIVQSTLGTIKKCLLKGDNHNSGEDEDADDDQLIDMSSESMKPSLPKGLGPTIAIMGLEDRLTGSSNKDDNDVQLQETEKEDEGELDLEGIDDDEIDSYIVTEREASTKEHIWMKMNAEYLKEQQEKEERLAKEKEEGKPEKKKRKVTRKPRNNIVANSAGEAIEKMLQEKKISNKINYDVLRSLTDMPISMKQGSEASGEMVNSTGTECIETDLSSRSFEQKTPSEPSCLSYGERKRKLSSDSVIPLEENIFSQGPSPSQGENVQELQVNDVGRLSSDVIIEETTVVERKKTVHFGKTTRSKLLPNIRRENKITPTSIKSSEPVSQVSSEETGQVTELDSKSVVTILDEPDDVEELEEEYEEEHDHDELSVAQLLSQHRGEDDEYYGEYDDEEYV